MPKIRVVLADDHTIVRKGIRSLLEEEEGIEVVGEAEDGREVLDIAAATEPDVVLMDVTMPSLNGLEATRRLKKALPQVKVLILTMHATEEYVFETLQAGASGYLLKRTAPTELIAAIRAVYQGESFLSPSISKTVIAEYIRQVNKMDTGDVRYQKLTDREREVLQLIAEGHTNKEIAQILCVSSKTVESHRSSLTNKLDMRSPAELTKYAIRKGLISL